MRFWLVVFLLLLTGSAWAEDFRLSMPIGCDPGRDCWVVKHVDLADGPEVRDFRCGAMTADTHRGVDFALRDPVALESGVPVLSAAPGIVLGFRDGMEDVDVRVIGRDTVKGRECGNGLLIDHGSGWLTKYCHMKKGSVDVKRGQYVERGEAVGFVGFSGRTVFPHLHFSVRKDGVYVDPFSLKRYGAGCGGEDESIWDEEARSKLAYRPVVVLNAGFSDRTPDWRVKSSEYVREPTLSTEAVLYLWVDVFGIRAGDRLTFRVRDARGKELLVQEVVAPEDNIRWTETAFWPPGDLPRLDGPVLGEVTLVRKTDNGPYTSSATARAVVR